MQLKALNLLPWQGNIQQWWQHLGESDRIPHAILLSGSQGAGKRRVANQIAEALFAQDEKSLALYRAQTHPDFFRIELQEKKKEISVEQIRELSSRVMLTSQYGGWRAVWIDPADRMSRGAANALLKILEEPPKNVMFILLADELPRLLPTIISRCQHLRFSLPDSQAAISWLAQQPEAAGLQPDELQDWLAICYGSPLTVLAALDEAADNNRLLAAQARMAALEALIFNKTELLACCAAFMDISADVDEHLQWLQGLALDLSKLAAGLTVDGLVNRRAVELLSQLAPKVAVADVLRYLQYIGRVRRGVQGNVNPELSLQAALLPWLHRLVMDNGEAATMALAS